MDKGHGDTAQKQLDFIDFIPGHRSSGSLSAGLSSSLNAHPTMPLCKLFSTKAFTGRVSVQV
jgi:hypothetical protein